MDQRWHRRYTLTTTRGERLLNDSPVRLVAIVGCCPGTKHNTTGRKRTTTRTGTTRRKKPSLCVYVWFVLPHLLESLPHSLAHRRVHTIHTAMQYIINLLHYGQRQMASYQSLVLLSCMVQKLIILRPQFANRRRLQSYSAEILMLSYPADSLLIPSFRLVWNSILSFWSSS